MNTTRSVTIYVVIDEMMTQVGHQSHPLARVSDAEILTVAVVAAAFFQNHQTRALRVLSALGYLSGAVSVSRFNRRVHVLAEWLALILETLGALFAHGQTAIADFVIDSMPLPVCRRARAWRCRKVRGRGYCGYCAAKKEKFFGWRLHLLCTPAGLPVAFTMLPGSLYDLTPIHELTYGLPPGSYVYADKGYNSAPDEASILAETGVRLLPIRKVTMPPHLWVDELGLRAFRKTIETVNSQREAMGIQRLKARTTAGFELKVHASLLALTLSNVA